MSIFKKIKENIFGKKIKSNKDYMHELAEKKNNLEKELEVIRTLALGSSHGAYGINPAFFDNETFNLCSTSQDLYYSYMLYFNLFKKLPLLDNIIISYSLFSAGFEVQKTIDKEICSYFKFLFDIDYKFPITKELKVHYSNCKKFLSSNDLKYKKNSGYNPPFRFLPPTYPVEQRVEAHLRENQRDNAQFLYIEKLNTLCTANKHKLIILIPPTRQDYRQHAKGEAIFQKIFLFAKKANLTILNLYGSDDFLSDDFGDFDHLNSKGSEKISKIINRFLINNKEREIK